MKNSSERKLLTAAGHIKNCIFSVTLKYPIEFKPSQQKNVKFNLWVLNFPIL